MSAAPDAAPIVIAGGGTAGHILPGLSVVNALVERGEPLSRVAWIGSSRGQEAKLVGPTGIPLLLLPGRGIQRSLSPRSIVDNVVAVAGLVTAVVRAFWWVGRHRPAVVVSLGGYASVAAALAAVVWRVPLVVAEQNAVAGAANRVLGRFAAAAAVPFEGTGLPRATVTGNPVRDVILARRPTDDADRAARQRAARLELGIDPGRLVVVAFAGSLGSRRINEAVVRLVDAWSERSDVAVYHVVGRRDFATFSAPQPPADGLSYRAVEYEERMDLVLAAADVAVCRSGGTTVAELAVIGVPSVLVPLPIAPGDHQRANGRALVAVGAAVLVDDADCTGQRLATELAGMTDDPAHLASMAAAARSIGRPDAAADTAALILANQARGRR
ncbi:MAG: UDP-N-acetylglucosamine--N-acetylmuramyl-(pentapeptide) pyrophosphoryl-undecaprenol N-acetylglucosamine transferase [Acidimicrobiales bacterium]